MAKIPRVPVENQITTLSVVKIAIKFSPCNERERAQPCSWNVHSRTFSIVGHDCVQKKSSEIDFLLFYCCQNSSNIPLYSIVDCSRQCFALYLRKRKRRSLQAINLLILRGSEKEPVEVAKVTDLFLLLVLQTKTQSRDYTLYYKRSCFLRNKVKRSIQAFLVAYCVRSLFSYSHYVVARLCHNR